MNHKNKKSKKEYDKTNFIDESFTCKICNKEVTSIGAGTEHRNHCPNCLSSIHLDNEPGDRKAHCDGIMEPIGVWVRKNGEWAIIHRCKKCGILKSNRIAADDNPIKLMSIAMKPIANPPFPIDKIEKMSNSILGINSENISLG